MEIIFATFHISGKCEIFKHELNTLASKEIAVSGRFFSTRLPIPSGPEAFLSLSDLIICFTSLSETLLALSFCETGIGEGPPVIGIADMKRGLLMGAT